jgi:hypothetical protein
MHSHRFLRSVLSSLNDIEEWRLGNAALARAKGYPREFPAEVIDDWGIVFLDVVIEAGTDELVCHEVNGANGVGTDALTGDSRYRAENEARQTAQRARDYGYLDANGRLTHPVAALHAHQHWRFFRTGGEFFPRVDHYASCLDAVMPGNRVALRNASEALGGEDVAVVFGDVATMVDGLAVDPQTRRFRFRGRPVIFIGNPNLVAELVRVGRLEREGRRYKGTDLRVVHGGRLTETIHDKGLQQSLLRGTGIRPLGYFEAPTIEAAVLQTQAMLERCPVVLKPNAGSGGAGIRVAVAGMSDAAIEALLISAIEDCRAKYGEHVERMIFPWRGFEFVRSTGYPMADGGHVWDLRIGVLFEPGSAQVFPVSIRIAPEPFDERSFHRTRDQWVSNVGGRQVTLLKSGMDDEALAAVGMTEEKLDRAMRGSLAWTLKAWDAASRDGGVGGSVYEDDCESSDPSFYPVEKFAAGGRG